MHKICFEGTRNLFTSIDVVRVQVKMHDEAKHNKKVAKSLKSSDFSDVGEKLTTLSSNLVLIAGKLGEGEDNLNDFEELQGKYDSRAGWLAFLAIIVVALTAAFETYLFRRSMISNKID